ncbi:coat protein [Serratia symbiotica]|uniref:Coat protein n=1 Tax=Serratia symbiotica TaxID=138074 RepID=A0A455VQ49_9GAMM|nr:coat protein [Serratia symbiotica]
MFAPDAQGEGSLGLISEAMSKAIDENKFQLEITLVNPQTGERRKVQTEGGGRVALSDAIIELNRHGGFFVLENLWL